MNDAFEELWHARLCNLPPASPLLLRPILNTDREYVSCVLCGHGHEEQSYPPEWLVTFRTDRATVTCGLHEGCRRRNGSEKS